MLVFDWSLDPLCQMLFFLITCCFSFIFFYNSLSIKPCRLLSLWSLKGFSLFQLIKSIRITFFRVVSSLLASRMSPRKKNSNSSSNSKVDTVESISEMSVLDLPDLVLETILEKLPPQELCRMASVCTSLREMCVSDHLWENHMKKKWSKVVGPAAYKEWQYQIASGKGPFFSDQGKENGLVGYLTQMWPFVLIRSSLSTSSSKNSNFPPPNSTMAWYFALESGKFWFPAQVYNRENGHVGFMLSCYDAEICYDQKTDTFNARYPPHGRRASPTESGITWDRLRAAPANSSPHDLHVSDCLNELRPGDHIEIQWRRNKEFPYGWWYGVVGHSETCDGNANYCRCHDCDMVVLEFNQYSRGSRWRTTNVFRKHHREEGNEADGFYGGIRKLSSSDEISTWKKIWPSDVLE